MTGSRMTSMRVVLQVYTAFDVVEKQVKAHFLSAPKDTWPKVCPFPPLPCAGPLCKNVA